ncbi:MAG: 50S ribosomal protein L18, partial [Fibrobacterales bacterium]
MSKIAKKRVEARKARHNRIRKTISGSAAKPRLAIKRSIKNIVAQLIDDVNGKSIAQVTTDSKEFQKEFGSLSKTEQSVKLGTLIADKAKSNGVEEVVFDRGGYL